MIVPPSRNRILAAAWDALYPREKKAKPAPEAKAPPAPRPKENALRSEPYRRLVAARPCKNCALHGHSQAAHVPPSGKGIKEDDRLSFPLCGVSGNDCHRQFDTYVLFGEKTRSQGLKWARETRKEITADGLWPKRLPKWEGR